MRRVSHQIMAASATTTDVCLSAIRESTRACRSVCSEKCCANLGSVIKGSCSSVWQHQHAAFVLRTRERIRKECNNECPAKLACFLFRDATPCYSAECRGLFERGVMNATCKTHLDAYCDVNQDECDGYHKALQECGHEGVSWSNCAVLERPSEFHWLKSVGDVASLRQRQVVMHPDAFQYIQACGCSTSCFGTKCPPGFFMRVGNAVVYRKSIVAASYVAHGAPVVSDVNIVITVLLGLYIALFWVARAFA